VPTPYCLPRHRSCGREDQRHPPDVQFSLAARYGATSVLEGLKSIENVSFHRRLEAAGKPKAVFFDPTEADPSIVDKLRGYAQAGWRLFGIAWHPPGTSKPRLQGIAYEHRECVHPAGPPICWCRKPLPGLVLECVMQNSLDVRECLLIGDSAADQTMARRLGMQHLRAGD
jgi:hypothetical protein